MNGFKLLTTVGCFSLRSGGALYISELYIWVMVVVVVVGGAVNLVFFDI